MTNPNNFELKNIINNNHSLIIPDNVLDKVYNYSRDFTYKNNFNKYDTFDNGSAEKNNEEKNKHQNESIKNNSVFEIVNTKKAIMIPPPNPKVDKKTLNPYVGYLEENKSESYEKSKIIKFIKKFF